MKIGIVGNCQSGVMAQWLNRMLPDHEIVHHSIARPVETYGPASEELAGCDLIISQPIGPEQGPLETDVLRDSGPRFILVPNLAFTGFQPDMGYIHYDDRGIVVSPVGAYHSRIVSACFHIGLGPIRTAKMFNSYIFEILGYFDEYDKARLNFEEAMAAQNLAVDIRKLSERGVFMHTLNHASAFANRVISFEAARKGGLAPLSDIEDIADEMLDDTVWPVYPQIANRLGIDGASMIFTRSAHLATDGRTRQIDLERMIEESFEIYARDKARIDFSATYRDAEILRAAIRRKYL